MHKRARLFIYTLILLAISHTAYGQQSSVALPQQDSVAMSVDVEQVTITGNKQIISAPDRYGNIIINTKQLFSMPHFGGTVDIVKMLQFSPGVIAPNDGDSSIYVRGSDAGQNLTLLNNAPVYSPAHLLGLFSVFNTAHIGGATFLKSSMPAEYGSILSSVFDIRPHSYIPEKFGIEGNLGLIESDLALQIPIGSKSAFYLSARHSYISWLVAALSKMDLLQYEFQDYGLTFVQDCGKAGKLVVNSHFNMDKGHGNLSLYDSAAELRWWDNTNSAVLTTPLGREVSMENTIYGTIFKNKFDVNLIGNDFLAPAGVTDIGAKSCTRWSRDKFELCGGFNYAYRLTQPQSIYSSLASENANHSTLQRSHETALFASILYKPWRHLEIDAGVRLSLYNVGKENFFNPEPRIMVAVPFANDARVWATYNITAQYLQLVPQSNAGFATDFFMCSTSAHPPQISYCTGLGYSQSALNNQLRWSVELFYRQMFHVLEFDARLNMMLSTNYDINDYIYSGEGEAYGAEFMLGYSHPKVDIQAHYTISRSLRRFAELNHGKAFAASSDRPHNLSLSAVYKPSQRWTISATFLYATGGAYTAPTGIHMVGGAFLKEYGAYNAARLPDYHRLDLSATFWFKSKRFQRNGINLSIYNAYSRRNPMLLSWNILQDEEKENTYHIIEATPALFEILPSISWTFKF